MDRFSSFDHAGLGFPLTGGHVQAPCTGSHAQVRSVAALAEAPESCVGCHRPDDAHPGRFGSDCAACHSTVDWAEADFDHVFPLDHGGQGVIACSTCHVEMPSFRSYTCYGCHDAEEMRRALRRGDPGPAPLRRLPPHGRGGRGGPLPGA